MIGSQQNFLWIIGGLDQQPITREPIHLLLIFMLQLNIIALITQAGTIRIHQNEDKPLVYGTCRWLYGPRNAGSQLNPGLNVGLYPMFIFMILDSTCIEGLDNTG